MTSQVNQLVDSLFRHESGRVLATLIRIFGVENLELAEDVLQETLIKALQQWSYTGVPENPSAWLIQVAKNRALDVLRQQSNYELKLSLLAPELSTQSLEESINFDEHMDDDQLTMLFMGCHPALSQEMQVTLLLKTLGGFSISEIAHAFLLAEATVAQRIVRAKHKLRDEHIAFVMPDESDFLERLNVVLIVIYLIFSEGYKASEGNQLIRKDLCYEAIRLCEFLLKHTRGNLPECHALMALMLFQVSRLDARIQDEQLVLLSDQDRAVWNQRAIHLGLYHLEQSASGTTLSAYHLQAGIAAYHATALTYEDTDWQQILLYYDQLIELDNSPFIQLNRLVALSMIGDVDSALRQLQSLEGLGDYYLYHATLADFEQQLGNNHAAIASYVSALRFTNNMVERKFIESKITAIKKAH